MNCSNHNLFWGADNSQLDISSSCHLKLEGSFLFVAQQPKSGLGPLIVDDSVSHTDTHTHAPWTIDQPVTEAATYTTHNKHKRRMSIHSARLEPPSPAIERPYTYVLDRTATGVGLKVHCCAQNSPSLDPLQSEKRPLIYDDMSKI